MNENHTKISIGIGDVLFVLFLVLKLTGLINWSWWWVFSPIWIPLILLIVCKIILLILENRG